MADITAPDLLDAAGMGWLLVEVRGRAYASRNWSYVVRPPP